MMNDKHRFKISFCKTPNKPEGRTGIIDTIPHRYNTSQVLNCLPLIKVTALELPCKMIDAPQLSTCITNNFIFFFDLFN